MRYLIFILLLFITNSCNFENGVNKNYIISQCQDQDDEKATIDE